MPLARLLVLVLSVAALAFAAAGCGGSDSSSSSGTDPETWAADVCGALSTWTDDLKTKSQSLSSDLQSSGDLKEVKSKLVAFPMSPGIRGKDVSSIRMPIACP